ncbi:aminoglycoside phosphotransferase-related-related [Anaeramoeba ignava]|uniref:Aminoglycoside phosphotransferase-related-related n=1 Tax=Anaeramoeba ignava TaxID=1746090 RepID=A0A9Q0R6X8_ANAIG|nr:aminoglycoside phosphotransferase-related-related [Anaeramoeba ignava]
MSGRPKVSISIKEVEKLLLEEKLIDSSVKCTELIRFNTGVLNFVYLIKTSCEKEFVLRIRTPGKIWKRIKTENEVAIHKFLNEKSTITIPKILAFSSDPNSAFGFEYMILEKKEGVLLESIWKSLTKEQKKTVLIQIVDFLVELRKFTFDQIGSFQLDRNGNLNLTKVIDLGKGPFNTYQDYLRARIEVGKHFILEEQKLAHFIPYLEKFAEEILPKVEYKDQFVFTHADLTVDNILIDPKNIQITAFLDWEWSGSCIEDDDLRSHLITKQILPDSELSDFFFAELIQKGIQKPKGFEEREKIFELIDFLIIFQEYKLWFERNPEEEEKFIQNKILEFEKFAEEMKMK